MTAHGEQSQNWTEKKQGRTEKRLVRSETTQSAFGQLGVKFYLFRVSREPSFIVPEILKCASLQA